MFSKSVSSITTADIGQLLNERAEENVRLEFKSESPSKYELLKKLTSFANTFGGDLVVGVKENHDGVVDSIPGIEKQNGYRQKITQWCFDGASPPLRVEVSEPIVCPSASDKFCYVVRISETESAPFFINGRRGVYVRTNEQSQRFEPKLAEQSELLALLDRRRSIVQRKEEIIQRASQRFESFASIGYEEHGSDQQSIGARFEMAIVPKFPSKEVVDQFRALEILENTRLDWRQIGFPRRSIPLVTQNESAIVLRPGSSFSILELNIWGLMYYASEIGETTDNWTGIHPNKFVGQILVFLHHAKQLVDTIGMVSDLEVRVNFDDVRGVKWLYLDRGIVEQGPSSKLDNSFKFSLDTTTTDLVSKPDSIAKTILSYVMFAMNWPSNTESDERLEQLVRIGYEYNCWTHNIS